MSAEQIRGMQQRAQKMFDASAKNITNPDNNSPKLLHLMHPFFILVVAIIVIILEQVNEKAYDSISSETSQNLSISLLVFSSIYFFLKVLQLYFMRNGTLTNFAYSHNGTNFFLVIIVVLLIVFSYCKSSEYLEEKNRNAPKMGGSDEGGGSRSCACNEQMELIRFLLVMGTIIVLLSHYWYHGQIIKPNAIIENMQARIPETVTSKVE